MTQLMIPSPGAPSGGERDGSTAAVHGAQAADLARRVPERIRQARTRSAVTRDVLPEIAGVSTDPVLSADVQDIWDASAAEGIAASRTLHALAKLWAGDAEAPDGSPDRDAHAIAAAVALRVTLRKAERLIRDAHRAVHDLPACFALLEEGVFPAPWLMQILHRTRGLSSLSRQALDQVVSGWDLHMSADTFSSWLSSLVHWLEDLETDDGTRDATPVERSVTLSPLPGGLALLQLVGPAPELVQASRRLDVTARAVRDAQRTALAEGMPIPWDLDGEVARTGKPMRLSTLRYLLLSRAELDPQQAPVPTDRFRITVTVPALTLLGEADAPGLLDGGMPVPADLARRLAGGESTWYRVLTDPCSGAFLPLPAQTYRPSAGMLEHLRLRGPRCAVPGCDRRVTDAAECDHIEEFLDGGRTDIENLHLLCRFHHQEKTAGRLDPVRLHGPGTTADGTHRPGITRWRIGTAADPLAYVTMQDDTDLIGALSLNMLEEHFRDHPHELCDSTCHHFGRRPRPVPQAPPPPPPPLEVEEACRGGTEHLARSGDARLADALDPRPTASPPPNTAAFDSYGDPPF
ncbi:HNH endonuclease signature motif containing protein [Brachybacterium hainanense]|uniref:DUF222 domain-containing protein n=1 Tax=Brachybacterium hainanense TaxID=1541174 RepID=A0ABV6R6M1_9MICO